MVAVGTSFFRVDSFLVPTAFFVACHVRDMCRRPDKLLSAQNLAVGTLTLFHTPPLTSRRRPHRQMKYRRYNIFIDMEQKKKGGYVNSKLIY
jgi:hypothetical protein